jgi:hypothetical protein
MPATPSQTTPPPEPIWERIAMCRLGVRDRAEHRRLRRDVLEEGRDYWTEKGRVVYAQTAIAKIAAHLAACAAQSHGRTSTPSAAETAQGSASQAGTQAISDPKRLIEWPATRRPHVLEVVRSTDLKNRQVLLARFPGDPDPNNLQTVRVRDHSNFIPGSATGRILAQHVANGYWLFAGNPATPDAPFPRCPRWRGKW